MRPGGPNMRSRSPKISDRQAQRHRRCGAHPAGPQRPSPTTTRAPISPGWWKRPPPIMVIGHCGPGSCAGLPAQTMGKGYPQGEPSIEFTARQATSDLSGTLRDTRYDMVLDFQAALKGAVHDCACTRAKEKSDLVRACNTRSTVIGFLNEKIPMVGMEIHALERGLMLLRGHRGSLTAEGCLPSAHRWGKIPAKSG